MHLLGIQDVKTDDILMVIPFGETYDLPEGYSEADVKLVNVVIPEAIPGCPPLPFSSRRIIATFIGRIMAYGIRYAAKALRVPECPSCKVRFLVLYGINQLGWKRAVHIIFKTLVAAPLTVNEQIALFNIWHQKYVGK